MNLNHFSRFEQLAQKLLEGSFGRLFGSQLLPADIAASLAAILDKEFAPDGTGGRPTGMFEVQLNPQDLDLLRSSSPQLESDLVQYLVTLAEQADTPFRERPAVRLVANSDVRPKQVWVQFAGPASDRPDLTDKTKTQAPESHSLGLRRLEETAAFIVIDGRRHVSLDRSLLTVGRQLDNDIVLDVPSVSRQHAQLRWRYGRFVLYDLGSQQGTFVNGELITEHVLQAGDVIRLSTVSMVYGEDPVDGNGSQPAGDGLASGDAWLGTTQRLDPGDGS